MRLGERVRILLAARGWLQRDLVKRSGLGIATVGTIISGKSLQPRPYNLQAIADSLGVPLDLVRGILRTMAPISDLARAADPGGSPPQGHPSTGAGGRRRGDQ